jgi:hypothetical protein
MARIANKAAIKSPYAAGLAKRGSSAWDVTPGMRKTMPTYLKQ